MSIHVLDGEVTAELTDLEHLNLVKTGKDVLTFVVPANQAHQEFEEYKNKKK